MKEVLLSFTLGPVQQFIAAARSMRDLWTGSYLLSWLTAHAMGAAESEGGRFVSLIVDQAGWQVFRREQFPQRPFWKEERPPVLALPRLHRIPSISVLALRRARNCSSA